MKIALSTLSALGYGGRTYFQHLLPALARVDKTNMYHIFVLKDSALPALTQSENFIYHRCPVSSKQLLARHFWEQIMIPLELKKLQVDLLFTAKNINLFLAPCKTVTSIRNMEPFFYRQYQNHWKLNISSWLKYHISKFSIQKADRVIAVSQFVKDYLNQHLGGLNGKMEVVYNGNPSRLNLEEGDVKGKEPFLLTASKFVAYANQLSLLKGYRLLCERRKDVPSLWLAGGVYDVSYFRKVKDYIEENGLANKVKCLGLIPHERMLQLYAEASAFVFPTTIEACPHTLIEAMAAGVPIATSNVGPMPEICQEAAVYFDPYQEEDIVEKLEAVLYDHSLRERLKKAALKRAQFFDWDKTASELVKVWEGLYS